MNRIEQGYRKEEQIEHIKSFQKILTVCLLGGIILLSGLILFYILNPEPGYFNIGILNSEKQAEQYPTTAKVREKIVFTTHTPVIAGNEVHDHGLLSYMGMYNGLTYGQMLSIGGDPFSMTVAGLRLSKKANAVAKLHCETAKNMWTHVIGASKIIAITNIPISNP